MPADRSAKARPSRVVPYEHVVSLETQPAPPPPPNASSMAHLVLQTHQPPQPQHAYSHPSYQHYPPPVYPYPQQPYPSYHYTQHPRRPHIYHPYPPVAPPPPAPRQPPQLHIHPHETPSTTTQRDGDTPSQAQRINQARGRFLTDDEVTKLVQIALRWIFVREQAVSPATFWTDVTESFERAVGRKFATCKRRMTDLEEQWRAMFAARDAEGGLQGNNNTDLARAMRAWIAFRDSEDSAKQEKDEDMKALNVRRRRLHELETERLGLTDVCRYETSVANGEEEIGPRGVDISERSLDGSAAANPITLSDEAVARASHPREQISPSNPDPAASSQNPTESDRLAPVVELLRKRQREEREEAEIRREEQILLNKRLAMMEEQVQVLSKLITQRQQGPRPATTSKQVKTPTNEEQALPPDSGAGTTAAYPSADIQVVSRDALPVRVQNSRAEESAEPASEIMLNDANRSTNVPGDTVTIAASASLNERVGVPIRPGAEATFQGPGRGTDRDSAANEPVDVSMDESVDSPEVPSAELNSATPISVLDAPTGSSHASEVDDD